MASNRSVLRLCAHRALRIFPLAMMVVLLLSSIGCDRGSSTDGQQPAGQAHAGRQPGQGQGRGPGQHGGPGAKPEKPAEPVAVGSAWVGPIASYYNSTATLESERQAQVLARASGLVNKLTAEEGDEVAANGSLLTISNDEYRLRVQQAAARTANLQARFDRLQAMLNEQLTTEEEFQTAKSELATAQADEGLAKLNLSYTTVRAPFAGLVTQRLVNAGQNVSIGEPLFMLADFHPLLARVHVPSRELHQLQLNQSVDLILDSDGSNLVGTIKLISPVIDATSGTIKITVEVNEYPSGTRPGDFAEVRIVTEMRPEAVLVPRSAVITDKGESVVYVAKKAEEKTTAERRVVTLGFSDDEHSQILTGLAAGEQIVTKGQRSLKNGSPIKILETSEAGATS